MEQRQVRVGDTLDDFCPRDNQVTMHTVVAADDDGVQVTRCQSCETEHDYPGTAVDATPAPGRPHDEDEDEEEIDDDLEVEVAEGDGRARAPDRDGPVRRPLIRATLKHPDGAPPPPREPPVFTMHEPPPSRGHGWGKPGGRGGAGAGTGGNGRARDGNTQAKKHGRRRGGQGRPPSNPQGSGGSPGNNRPGGNQTRPDARPGARSRSSRRGRGRSR